MSQAAAEDLLLFMAVVGAPIAVAAGAAILTILTLLNITAVLLGLFGRD